jgi:MYXO-CTERM domain-containing protein
MLAVASVLVTTPCLATTYQVGPTRTLKTLAAVAEQLNPGDVVELDGNASYSGGIVLDRAGAAGNPITVRGVRVNGKRPVLTGGTNTIEIRADHYVLEGMDITAGSARCVYHHADDVTLRDLVVHDCKAHGLLGADQDSGSLTLEYSEFYGSGSGTGEHQIYMATDEVAHPGSVFRMQHCYVHDGTGGNNVKSRAERNEIYYNWIEGAVYHELELIGPDPEGAPSGWTEALKREDSDVVGNVLRKTQTTYVVRFGGDGTGQSNGRYRFVANTVLTAPGGSAVFRLFDGLESVEMHDNLFFVDPTPSGATTIVRDTEAIWSTGARLIAGSHNWVLTQAASVPAEWTATLTGANPGLVSLASLNLSPLVTSPLADACTCMAGTAGHEFPRPLPWPAYEPPRHAFEAPGTALARSVSGQLYIGAYQPEGSSGSGGAGGATNSGGATNGGATSSGGGASVAGANNGGLGSVAGSGGTSGVTPSGGAGALASGGVAQGFAGSTGGDRSQAGSGNAPNQASGDSATPSGCNCRVTRKPSPSGQALTWLTALGLAWLARRRRRSDAL